MRKYTKRTFLVAALTVLLILSMLFATSTLAAETPNVIFFESFENGLDWQRLGGVATDHSNEIASDGSCSVRIEDDAPVYQGQTVNQSGGARSEIIPLEKNKYYDVTVDVYNDSGNASVFLEFWNGSVSGNPLSQVSSTATDTGRWTTLSFSVMLPDGASGMTVWLYSGLANKGVAYFDNVIVKEEAPDAGQNVMDFEVKNTSYPRLYFTENELAELKSLKDQKSKNECGFIGDKTVSSLISDADKLLTQSSFKMTYYSTANVEFKIPFEEKHFTSSPAGYSGSNYPYWQEMGNQMKDMMQTLSLAYALTGEAKYADRAIELMDSLCAWSTWTEHPTINRTSLETGYFTVGVSTVYDICYDRLNDTQKTNAIKALKEKGLDKLYSDLSAFTDHNYYVNKATALAVGSCLVLDADTDAKRYLSRAYEYMDWYLKNRSASESQEGLSYTSYSLDLIAGALDIIKRVTGNDSLMSNEYMETVFVWAVMSAENASGIGPQISDVYNSTYFYTTACVMNREGGNALAGYYVGSRVFEVTDFARIVYYCPDMKSETPDEYSERTGINLKNGVIPSIGWGALRTGWGKDDMALICVANNSSQGHSHFDQNSFVLSLGNGWLLSDPGYQDYGGGYKSDYSLSYGHSTVYVDGKAQDFKGKSTLKTMMDSSAYSYLLGSAGGAYKSLSKFDRSFVMVNHSGASYYVIADELVSSSENEAHKYSFVLNAQKVSTFRQILPDGSLEGISKNRTLEGVNSFVLSGSGGSLKVSFDSKTSVHFGAWNGIGSLITVSGGDAAVSDSFCAVLAPIDGNPNKDSAAAAVSVAESFTNGNQNGVRAEYGQISDIILISKGMGVDGGGLSSDGSSATLFGLNNGEYIGYSVTEAKELTYDGKKLIESDTPISAAIYFDGSECVVNGAAGSVLKLYVPDAVDGVERDADGYVTLTLKSEREVVELGKLGTDNGDASSSDGSDDKNDGEVWITVVIIIASVVVLSAGIVVILLVFKKKKSVK